MASCACSIRLCPNSSTDCRPSHAYQLDAFAAAVLRGQAVKTTPKDAVENMSAIDAIYWAAGLPSRNPSRIWSPRAGPPPQQANGVGHLPATVRT